MTYSLALKNGDPPFIVSAFLAICGPALCLPDFHEHNYVDKFDNSVYSYTGRYSLWCIHDQQDNGFSGIRRELHCEQRRKGYRSRCPNEDLRRHYLTYRRPNEDQLTLRGVAPRMPLALIDEPAGHAPFRPSTERHVNVHPSYSSEKVLRRGNIVPVLPYWSQYEGSILPVHRRIPHSNFRSPIRGAIS